MISLSKSYDFFISYAGPDIAYAQALSDTLRPVGRIFLAPQSFLPGEDWPTRLPALIKDTWVMLVIISQHTPAAHFQMEEILLAIRGVRAGFHVVVPIRISVDGQMPQPPVGLNSKNCLDLPSGSQAEINSIVDKLSQPEMTSGLALAWDGGPAVGMPVATRSETLWKGCGPMSRTACFART
ncbi:MAG: toll/interleukin-1 receptor domain-containing protein [Pseudonocardiaceae bacterium]